MSRQKQTKRCGTLGFVLMAVSWGGVVAQAAAQYATGTFTWGTDAVWASAAGGTTNKVGIMQLDRGVAKVSSVTGNIVNHAMLVFANPNAQTYDGRISGTGTLKKAGAGTLTLTQAQCLSSNTAVNIASGLVKLGFTGTNTVRSLTVNGELQVRNRLYSKNNLPAAFHSDGSGYLFVTEGKPPAGTKISLF